MQKAFTKTALLCRFYKERKVFQVEQPKER